MWKICIEWWKAVKEYNKKLTLLHSSWYVYLIFNAQLLWATVACGNPYAQAKIRLSYYKYKESFAYRERCEVMGSCYAHMRFVDEHEHKYYIKQLTWGDKLQALCIPFSILSREV